MFNITEDKIEVLEGNQIFVFGSNLSGRHGAGAAKTALQWGAKWGQPTGLQGKTYAIPTKDKDIKRTLEIDEIKVFVDEFIQFANENKQYMFLVTEVGCGLAGLKHEDVALLFKKCIGLENVSLPEKFWNVLINKEHAV